MPREKENYRQNLERVKNMFPEKEVLTKSDVVKFSSLTYKTVVKMFPFKGNYISVASLASCLS